GEQARAWIAATTGIEELQEIERLIVAFYPVDAAPPQVSLVVTLRTARPREELLAAWHNPKAAGKDKAYYQGPSWAYYFPPQGSAQTFVVAPPALMPEVVEQTGPPVMRKEMEKLLRDTDDSRHLTLLLAPNFLFSEGKLLLSGDLAKLKE